MPVNITPEPVINARAAEFLPEKGLTTQTAPMNVTSPINQLFVTSEYIPPAVISSSVFVPAILTKIKAVSYDSQAIGVAAVALHYGGTSLHRDTLGEHDNVNRATVKTTGVYRIEAVAKFIGAHAAAVQAILSIYKNGVVVSTFITESGAGFADVFGRVSDELSLTKGDYIEIWGSVSAGAYTMSNTIDSFFIMDRVE